MGAPVGKETVRSVAWIHQVMVDDVLTFRVGRCEGAMVAEWPGLATFDCARDGSGPHLTPISGASPRAIEKLRHGYVRALLRDLHGHLSVHASAVALGGRAVVFVGPSGVGKSTVAAEMCLQQGAELLADDVVLFDVGADGVRVVPSERQHWLNADSCLALGFAPPANTSSGDKHELAAPHVARNASRLALTVALGLDPSAGQAMLRPLHGSSAACSLLEAVIRFDVEDPTARRRELEQVTRIYNQVPFLQLVRSPVALGRVGPLVIGSLRVGNP